MISQGIDQGNSRVIVVEKPLDAAKIASFPKSFDGVDLPQAVRAQIIRQPKGALRPLDISPDCLPGLVSSLGARSPRKCPNGPGLRPDVLQKVLRQVDSALFAGLTLPNGHPLLELMRLDLQNVADAEAGLLSDTADQPILRHKQPIDNVKIVVPDIVHNDTITPPHQGTKKRHPPGAGMAFLVSFPAVPDISLATVSRGR